MDKYVPPTKDERLAFLLEKYKDLHELHSLLSEPGNPSEVMAGVYEKVVEEMEWAIGGEEVAPNEPLLLTTEKAGV